MITIDEDDYLAHFGILRKSGRYPWGSGQTVSARSQSFFSMVDEARRQGLDDKDIAKGFGMTTTMLRQTNSLARNQQKQAQINQAMKLRDKGMSNVAAAKQMGVPESTYRTLLDPSAKDRNDVLVSTADMLRRQVAEKKYIDVGVGVENHLGVSKERLGTAVSILQDEGYALHNIPVLQLGTGKETSVKVLAPPGTTWGEIKKNQSSIQTIHEFSEDGGRTFGNANHPPIPVHPDRVAVRYADEGGKEADGVIYVRPNSPELSMGNSRYAQVRIQVGDGHYLKGMAVYKDDLPPGVDLMFNTNKSNTGNKLDAMKPLKDDPDLPFGSIVRQVTENTGTPHERNISAINIVNPEGKWDDWSNTLSSQMLSKQPPSLAREQLSKDYSDRKKDLDQIKALTNPTVRKELLASFADSTDKNAVHLKAASLPRQANKVILPINSMKKTEVYAPTYENGERVVLIRFPHGGTFEIPELTVNNRQPEAKKLLGNAKDAIGIHSSVAERLSGADFDGDTVLVIPNYHNKVQTSPSLARLKGFDPRSEYKEYPGMRVMTKRETGIQMGDISNLITDMTIHNAPHSEIVRAVRHSMVVIDAEKHKLNWKQSAIDMNIPELKTKYQGGPRKGAATLLSRKKGDDKFPDFKERPAHLGGPIDRETGRKVYVETGRTNADGSPRMVRASRLGMAEDAKSLISEANTPMERLYADHSNKLKGLANEARLSYVKTPNLTYNPSAKRVYAKEVERLDKALALAKSNSPRERQAQILATAQARLKIQANPHLDDDQVKKIKFQALEDARARLGAKKEKIEISDTEWDAIQAGAISNNKLSEILKNTDLKQIRELATPKPNRVMTSTSAARARAMLATGATRSEVANALGVSLSTLDKATKDPSSLATTSTAEGS